MIEAEKMPEDTLSMSLQDKVRFLRRHADDFKLIAKNKDDISLVMEERSVGKDDTERVNNALEEFETKIWVLKKTDNVRPDARRVILDVAETLSASDMFPVIEQLKTDSRCSSICLLADNVAGRQFEAKNDPDFKRIDDHSNPLFADIPGLFDVAIVSIEPVNSPNSVLLYGAKSVFGSKKLYFSVSGWHGLGGMRAGLFAKGRPITMDSIDGILCTDELAKRVIMRQLPEFPQERIYATGSPSLDALDVQHGFEYEHRGRSKLGLNDDTVAVLCMPSISSRRGGLVAGIHERIEEETFERVISVLVHVAENCPDRMFVLLVRPHPGDSNKDEYLQAVTRSTPKNMKIVLASNTEVSMQEAGYAADVVVMILGTEGFYAPLRGKQSAFLALEEPGLGGKLWRNNYDEDMIQVLAGGYNPRFIKTQEQLAEYFMKCHRAPSGLSVDQSSSSKSVENILDVVLS